MEKTAILLGCRNDGYKEDERVITCLTSMLETFDEVWFCDWNSPTENGPLLWKLKDQIPQTGKIRHFIITEDIARLLSNNNPNVSPFNAVLSQNIMLKRCTADWIVCSTMDIIAPKKEYFDDFISKFPVFYDLKELIYFGGDRKQLKKGLEALRNLGRDKYLRIFFQSCDK